MAVNACAWRDGVLWRAADSALCLLLFFPSMLLYWRGIWDVLGVYIIPDQVPLCHWVTTAVGACTLIGYLTVPLLARCLSRDRVVTYFIATRLFMYVYGALSMSYWRGVWSLADYYLEGFGWGGSLVGLGLCYGALTALRVSRTLVFPPFSVCLDTREDLLTASTLLGTKVRPLAPY